MLESNPGKLQKYQKVLYCSTNMQQSQALLERAGLNVVQEDGEGLHNTLRKVHKSNQLFKFGFAESEF